MSILYSLIKAGKIKVHQRSPALHRFWVGVDKNGPIHPEYGKCWQWIRCLVGGYGQCTLLGERYAHRVSYIIHYGEIPNGLWVLHKCDNHLCVNPSHLFLGTRQDNTNDMLSKGRQAKGERSSFAKLTEEDVLEIRRRYKRETYHRSNSLQLANEFGVNQMTIARIIRREIWKHI